MRAVFGVLTLALTLSLPAAHMARAQDAAPPAAPVADAAPVTAPASADKASAIEIQRVTTIARIAEVPTASVFMIITNRTGQADRLVGATSPLASTGVLNESVVDEKTGQMSLRPTQAIDLPVNEPIVLAPAASVVQLRGLTGTAMNAGQTFPLTLKFENAGTRTVNVEVVPLDQLSKRYPPEMMGANLQKIRAIGEAKAKAEKKPFLTRVRDKIRSIGGYGEDGPKELPAATANDKPAAAWTHLPRGPMSAAPGENVAPLGPNGQPLVRVENDLPKGTSLEDAKKTMNLQVEFPPAPVPPALPALMDTPGIKLPEGKGEAGMVVIPPSAPLPANATEAQGATITAPPANLPGIAVEAIVMPQSVPAPGASPSAPTAGTPTAGAPAATVPPVNESAAPAAPQAAPETNPETTAP